MIKAVSLSKKFESLVAVNELTFSLARGSFFAFVGPNGAGKTTLMRMICGLSPITSGRLWVDGKSLPEELAEVKAILGVVPQDSNLDHDLSVIDNLLLHARYFGIPKSQARERAEELLSFMHLNEKRNARVPQLSGGMRRRLQIARALMNSPRLLILDEPTTGLDPQMRHLIWDKLGELREQGITLLLTTHYMEEAEVLTDQVGVMNKGEILVLDSPLNLRSRFGGTLEEVFLELTGEGIQSEE